ncbi:hypothetical protein [Piscirickettsia salmonis]|nr:hypothetical protein [Piscirickettsia salmonis]
MNMNSLLSVALQMTEGVLRIFFSLWIFKPTCSTERFSVFFN